MSWLVTLVLNWVWGKISSLIAAFVAKEIAQEEIQKEAEASVVPLKNAETAADIDKAADDALNGL